MLVLLLAGGVLVGVGAGPAFACSCALSTVRDHVGYADVIVIGTLTNIEDPPKKRIMSSGDPVTYTVAVDQTFKGEPSSEVLFTSAMSGATCGLEGLQADRRYAFFLNSAGKGLDASLCGGTAPASLKLDAQIARWTGPPETPAVAPAVAAPGEVDAHESDAPSSESSSNLSWVLAGGVAIILIAGACLVLRARSHRSTTRPPR